MSCGNFTAADLMQCREELEILSGCCNPTCISTFAEVKSTSFTQNQHPVFQVPLQCLTDLSQILCDDYTNLLLPLSRVALRCKENFQVQDCKGLPMEVVVDENGLQTLTTEVEITPDNVKFTFLSIFNILLFLEWSIRIPDHNQRAFGPLWSRFLVGLNVQ